MEGSSWPHWPHLKIAETGRWGSARSGEEASGIGAQRFEWKLDGRVELAAENAEQAEFVDVVGGVSDARGIVAAGDAVAAVVVDIGPPGWASKRGRLCY